MQYVEVSHNALRLQAREIQYIPAAAASTAAVWVCHALNKRNVVYVYKRRRGGRHAIFNRTQTVRERHSNLFIRMKITLKRDLITLKMLNKL